MSDHKCLIKVLNDLESYGPDWSDNVGEYVRPLGNLVAKQLHTKYEYGKYYQI